MSDSSYRFTHAITRRLSPAVVEGLRAVDVGSPSFERMLEDHQRYVATLQEAGATVHELPALDDYPDALFVEDAALCLVEGAILIIGTEILVGRSERTDAEGVAELRKLVEDWGYTVREVMTPEGVLHFKTDCSLLSPDTILSTKRLAASGCFADYTVVYTAEEASANAIRFNDVVVMAAGFPSTAASLRDQGYVVKEINNSECSKIDGGMSCLSLRLPI